MAISNEASAVETPKIPAVIEATPKQPAVTAETATRTINGETYTRALRTCRETGASFYQYGLEGYPSGPDGPGRPYRVIGGESMAQRFAVFAGRLHALPFDLGEADRFGDELKAFGANFPLIAAKLGEGHRPPGKAIEPGLFDLGPVSVESSVSLKLKVSRVEILAALRRHVAGDLGLNGKVEPGRPPEDDIFLPFDLPPDRKAAVAIFEGRGIVQSRFLLWTAEDALKDAEHRRVSHFVSARYHRNPQDYIDITTLLSGPQTRTVVSGSSCSDNF